MDFSRSTTGIEILLGTTLMTSSSNTMNRLAVDRSARAQQGHKVNNRINRLMPLHKTDTDTNNSYVWWPFPSLVLEFYSGQDRHTRQTQNRHTWTVGNPRSVENHLFQTIMYFSCFAVQSVCVKSISKSCFQCMTLWDMIRKCFLPRRQILFWRCSYLHESTRES